MFPLHRYALDYIPKNQAALLYARFVIYPLCAQLMQINALSSQIRSGPHPQEPSRLAVRAFCDI